MRPPRRVLQLVLGFVHAGHVGKGDALLFVLVEQLGLGTAKGHGLAAPAALHLAHGKEPYGYEQEHGEPGGKDRNVPGLVVQRLGLDLNLLFQQQGDKLVVPGNEGVDGLAVRGRGRQVLALYGHGGNLSALHAGQQVGIGNRLLVLLWLLEHVEQHHHAQNDDSPHYHVA